MSTTRELVRLSRRIYGDDDFASVEITRRGDILLLAGQGRSVKLFDEDFEPDFPSYLAFGSDDFQTVPASANGQAGISQKYKFSLSGTDQYIKGESIYLETQGSPTDASITGHEVYASNYNTTGVLEMYGYASRLNLEWPTDYAYGGFFSATPGSVNASGGLPFVCGISGHTGFGHHANTGRSVAVEAVIESSPSGSPVVGDEVIGLNVWGVANNNCTATKAYGVYLESFTKSGSGSWGSIYGLHADAGTFDNTSDGWFLHSESDVPSLFSGPLHFAVVDVEPAAPAAGRVVLFAILEGGKVAFKAKFPTGASQQVAKES